MPVTLSDGDTKESEITEVNPECLYIFLAGLSAEKNGSK